MLLLNKTNSFKGELHQSILYFEDDDDHDPVELRFLVVALCDVRQCSCFGSSAARLRDDGLGARLPQAKQNETEKPPPCAKRKGRRPRSRKRKRPWQRQETAASSNSDQRIHRYTIYRYERERDDHEKDIQREALKSTKQDISPEELRKLLEEHKRWEEAHPKERVPFFKDCNSAITLENMVSNTLIMIIDLVHLYNC